MFWAVITVLLLLWLIAVFSGHIVGGLIHILLVAAIIVLLFRVIKGRKSAVRHE
jgi:hypothetical protein